MKTERKLLTGTLLALCGALLALCIVLAAGWSKAAKTDAALPEVRNNGTAIQWRYSDETDWRDLVALTDLRGAAGEAGKDGADGKDGNTPFIGENGNWWIGTTDTGVKATGVDGEKGDKGDTGEKGDKGDKGDAGQDGSSPGWFYGVGVVQSVDLRKESAPLYFQGKMSSGGLVSCDGDTVRLSRGHHYQVSVNGAVYAMSNDDKGFYSVRMTDGYDNQLCRDLTSIKVDKGKKLNETRREQHTLSFNRVYDAKGGDIVLRLALEQAEYATYLLSFRGTITITALD